MNQANRLIFVLGGARSGKSTFAENWLKSRAADQRVLYVATAQAHDEDMQARVKRHRAERPAAWDTLEAPRQTAAAVDDALNGHTALLLDCVTFLAANILLELPEDCTQEYANDAVLQDINALLDVFHAQDNMTWLVVSNEVGMGVVPPTRLGRFFRDMLGRANQRLAAEADEVVLMVAGLPWTLKPYRQD